MNFKRIFKILIGVFTFSELPKPAAKAPSVTHLRPNVKERTGSQRWYDREGRLHREDGPALIEPPRQEGLNRVYGFQKWFLHGVPHRDDGPAFEYANGERRWFDKGKLHRMGAPAVEWLDHLEQWWTKGQLHRENGPAVTDHSFGIRKWYLHGRLHRLEGPAIEDESWGKWKTVESSKQWYVNGKRHRLDGPAVEIAVPSEAKLEYLKNSITNPKRVTYSHADLWCYYGDKEWWVNGKLHREGGPAIERLDGTKKWYRFGRLHRKGAPAAEYPNGSKEWWLRGRLHRADGPAVDVSDGFVLRHGFIEDWDGYNNWRGPEIRQRQNESLRRQAEELPAVNFNAIQSPEVHRGKEWWVKGKQLTEEQFNEWRKTRKLPTETVVTAIERKFKVDLSLLKEKAAKDHHISQSKLAFLYYEGVAGVARDYKEAYFWLSIVAERCRPNDLQALLRDKARAQLADEEIAEVEKSVLEWKKKLRVWPRT